MKHPHELTPFYKMPSFWLFFVAPIIAAIIMIATNPQMLMG